MSKLEEMKEKMSEGLFGLSRKEAIKKGVCLNCGKPALERCYSDAGRREFLISGFCELCFDKMFEEDKL